MADVQTRGAGQGGGAGARASQPVGREAAAADPLEELARFPLVEALLGRRARRFPQGGEIPDGPFAFKSTKPARPLDDRERLLVLAAMGGTTGWHFALPRHPAYAPHLPNYPAAAAGRTFPSAAGFHTTELFFTDDTGTYMFPTRDAGALVDPTREEVTLPLLLERHAGRIVKLSDRRLDLPRRFPFMESHNTWIANAPGSLLAIPVADVAQHVVAAICYYVQNGVCLTDDVHGRAIPDLERFRAVVDPAAALPISFLEQLCLVEATVELATSCYAGALMLQAMGLGGWMYDGIDPLALLGASGDPDVPGLGFRYDQDPRWTLPNPTGIPGVFEASCPPHVASMADAVRRLVRRKFGPGGVFHPGTPGAWTESAAIRASAVPFTDEHRACAAHQASYVLEAFGKFPGTVPSVHVNTFVQAQHIDLDFYDRFFRPGAYLPSHAAHDARWHPQDP